MKNPPLLLPLLCLLACALSSQAQQPELTADELSDQGENLIAKGNASLETRRFHLKADTVTYHKTEQSATATGEPVEVTLLDPRARMITRHLNYRVLERTLSSQNFRLGRPPLLLEGKTLESTNDSITISDGTLYFHEPDPWSLNIRATTLTLQEPDTIIARDATLRIGNVPLWRMSQQTLRKNESPLRIKSKVGIQKNLGAYAQNTLLLPAGGEQDIKLGALIDGYSRRGVLVGPAAEYHIVTPQTEARGQLRGGHINDQGRRGTDANNRRISPNRHFLQWEHQQTLEEKTQITARLGWLSDSEVERDFRSTHYSSDPQPDTFVETTYRESDFLVSAFVRPRPNDFYPVRERLPELRLDYLPTPLGETGILHETQASFSRLRDKDTGRNPYELQTQRAHLYYGWRRPTALNHWLTLTPVVGTTATHYSNPQGHRDSYTRLLGQVGFDATARAYTTSEYTNEKWQIQGLRHIVRPVVQYRYIPEAQRGRSSLPLIDRDIHSTLLPPLDLAQTRQTDEKSETHTTRFGLENTLQTRDAQYGSRDLLRVNLYQDLHFSTTPGQRDFSNTYTEAELTPIHWLSFGLYNRMDPERLSLEETRARLKMTDGDAWTLLLTADALEQRTHQYYIDLAYRIDERHTLTPRWRYDARLDKLTEQLYAVRTRLGNTWLIEYGVGLRRGDRRNNDIHFSLGITLLH